MKGDFSVAPEALIEESVSTLLVQQGRALLDSDWNRMALSLLETIRRYVRDDHVALSAPGNLFFPTNPVLNEKKGALELRVDANAPPLEWLYVDGARATIKVDRGKDPTVQHIGSVGDLLGDASPNTYIIYAEVLDVSKNATCPDGQTNGYSAGLAIYSQGRLAALPTNSDIQDKDWEKKRDDLMRTFVDDKPKLTLNRSDQLPAGVIYRFEIHDATLAADKKSLNVRVKVSLGNGACMVPANIQKDGQSKQVISLCDHALAICPDMLTKQCVEIESPSVNWVQGEINDLYQVDAANSKLPTLTLKSPLSEPDGPVLLRFWDTTLTFSLPTSAVGTVLATGKNEDSQSTLEQAQLSAQDIAIDRFWWRNGDYWLITSANSKATDPANARPPTNPNAPPPDPKPIEATFYRRTKHIAPLATIKVPPGPDGAYVIKSLFPQTAAPPTPAAPAQQPASTHDTSPQSMRLLAPARDLPLARLTPNVSSQPLRKWLASALVDEVATLSCEEFLAKVRDAVDVSAGENKLFEREARAVHATARALARGIPSPVTIATKQAVRQVGPNRSTATS